MLFFILVCLTLEKVSHKKNLVFGEPCIFPWKDRYTNLTHQGCANPDQDEVGLWCPTQLDEDGYYPLYNGPGSFWGYCDENCNFTFAAELRVIILSKAARSSKKYFYHSFACFGWLFWIFVYVLAP